MVLLKLYEVSFLTPGLLTSQCATRCTDFRIKSLNCLHRGGGGVHGGWGAWGGVHGGGTTRHTDLLVLCHPPLYVFVMGVILSGEDRPCNWWSGGGGGMGVWRVTCGVRKG